ncbi:GtrA family protein [Muricoccus radiodurans]|uniref:GtrA family protein n=1 Tax=Muricoccus radiodurans TaxID=2231721 RepID=UPI003CECCB36
MTRDFLAFAMVGGAAAFINVLAGRALSLFVPLEAAVILAFPLALTFAYSMNRRFVFRSRSGLVRAEYARFVYVNLLALAVVWLVTVAAAHLALPAVGWTWHPETVAHTAGVASPILLSFWLHKAFTFQSSAEAKETPLPPATGQ